MRDPPWGLAVVASIAVACQGQPALRAFDFKEKVTGSDPVRAIRTVSVGVGSLSDAFGTFCDRRSLGGRARRLTEREELALSFDALQPVRAPIGEREP